jgi:hypothetical protein
VGSAFVPGATSVRIGGLELGPASVMVKTDGTGLSFVTPPGPAGPAAVAVTTPGGASARSLPFTYLAATVDPPIAHSPSSSVGPPVTTVPATAPLTKDNATAIVPEQPTVTISPRSVTPIAAGSSVRAAGLRAAASAAPTTTSIAPRAGASAGGTTVTITGTGFVSGQTTVKIGALQGGAVTVAAGGSSLTFVTPANPTAGAVPVTVTAPGGTAAGLAFTYVTPVPADPVDNTIVGGSTPTATTSSPPPAGTNPAAKLALTGFDPWPAAGAGILLILFGAILATVTRRRIDHDRPLSRTHRRHAQLL